jgi:multicomponent Na+:H+ antiporter subunit D
MNFKGILAIHIISQIGYMVMGLGMYSVMALTGAIYYIVHNMLVKTSLFLLQGVTQKITGTAELKEMGGLLSPFPWLGWSFLVAGLSLAGVPPLSGFFSKFLLLSAAAQSERYWLLAAILGVGFFTLFSMLKIFIYVFWGKEKTVPAPQFNYLHLLPGALLLIALSVGMGLAAEPVIGLTARAAQQLMDPQLYIHTVLSVAGSR